MCMAAMDATLPSAGESLPGPARVGVAAAAIWPVSVLLGEAAEASAVWRQVRPQVERYRAARVAAGADVEDLDLPSLGIAGNSHLPMMDSNSDDVAARIQAWMERKGLMA